MGFFAGKYSDGKTVLSLNTASGGDINAHKNPSTNTIFHSDMPFVLVESTYESALSSAGNGFYVCQMPSAIANLKSNDPGRVILTAIEVNGTHRGFLNGTQSQVGQFLSSTQADPFRSFASLSQTAGFAFGNSLASGTYSYNSSLGHEESIARSGTGGTVLHSTYHGVVRPGGGAPVGATVAETFKQLGYPIGSTSVPISSGDTYYWDPNWMAPMGAGKRGHNWFYVCNSNIRGYAGYKQTIPSNIVQHFSDGGYRYVCRGSTTKLVSQSANTKIVQDGYGVTPTKVIWYVLNLRYSNGSMSVSSNPFTGSDIIISPSNFTIKGVKLSTTGWKFINQNALGNLSSRADMEYIGVNAAHGGVFGDTTGRCEFVCSNKGSIWAPVNYSGTRAQLSIYKFSASKTWYVNSNNNTIGNENGVVWGPSSIPLRLLSGNVASAYIGNDITPTYPGTGNVYKSLATVGLGLPNNNSTVILTSEILSGNLNVAGLPVNTWNGSVFQVQGRKSQSYTGGDAIFHQILVLPPGKLVPFHTTSAYKYTPDSGAFSRNSFIYTIKNLGNGSAELGVILHVSLGSAVFLPRLRVTVQRLT